MDTFFGKVENPCEDCVDGECTMNCSGREAAQTEDKGSFGVTREKDGTVTVRVRSPGQYTDSSITMTRNIWDEVSAGPFRTEVGDEWRPSMTESKFEQWREWSRTDDKLQNFVLSDIRQMIGKIDRLRRDKTRLEGLVEGYK